MSTLRVLTDTTLWQWLAGLLAVPAMRLHTAVAVLLLGAVHGAGQSGLQSLAHPQMYCMRMLCISVALLHCECLLARQLLVLQWVAPLAKHCLQRLHSGCFFGQRVGMASQIANITFKQRNECHACLYRLQALAA